MVLSFRCYGLDRNGRIVAAENVEASDTDGAIDLGRRFIASRQEASHQADAGQRMMELEVWQGGNLVFTTLKDRPGSRDREHAAYVFRRKHAALPG
jgi:hypothetical protein